MAVVLAGQVESTEVRCYCGLSQCAGAVQIDRLPMQRFKVTVTGTGGDTAMVELEGKGLKELRSDIDALLASE